MFIHQADPLSRQHRPSGKVLIGISSQKPCFQGKFKICSAFQFIEASHVFLRNKTDLNITVFMALVAGEVNIT